MKRLAILFSISLFGFSLLCFPTETISNVSFNELQSDTIIINLRDYGLDKTRKKDCTEIISKALKEINNSSTTLIRFPRGEYHFYAEESTKRNYVLPNATDIKPLNCAILIENKSNVIIDGNGSTLIFHGQIQPFTFDNCKNIIVKNIHIDWEQPLTAQAEITKVNDEFIELALDLKESSYRIDNGKLFFAINRNENDIWKNATEFDREGRYIEPQTGDNECLGKGWENYAAENIIPGVIRLYYPFQRKPKVGNFLVLQHVEQNHPGIFFNASNDITVKNVTVYYAAGVGILVQNCDNLTFNEFRAIPNNTKNRYFGGGFGGLFISNCTGEIMVDKSEFEGLMNDPIIIHNTKNQIIENKDTTEFPTSSVTIINSQFKSSRWSGIRISSAEKVKIEKNIFESSGSAILITGSKNNKSWFDGANNVLIENNEFSDLCNTGKYEFNEGIISIYPEIQPINQNIPQIHRNISIINNRFNPSDYSVLFARSVDGLVFDQNTVTRSNRFEPFHSRHFTFTFEACRNVSLNNTSFSGDVLGKNIQLKWMPESELNCSQAELKITLMKTIE